MKIDKINEFKHYINNKNIPKQTFISFRCFLLYCFYAVSYNECRSFSPHCLVYLVHLRHRHHQPEYILFVNFVVNILIKIRAIPIFEKIHSGIVAIFAFDNFSSYAKLANNTLNAANMNFNFSRKQPVM
ncbi:hypothetical protein RhiirC2_792431 [Rhizophagus irregularis]|uniref:Uncharacterized protein n=1 Tax=Rhizophagus irregularis TaxID=588596 RepID=A0A2N1MHC6_9GLOM|nr:hypothetical protein RhiirC2_792431 [Rhizophagus irregularis]